MPSLNTPPRHLLLLSSQPGDIPPAADHFLFTTVRDPAQAIGLLRAGGFAAVCVTLPLSQWSAEEFLEEALRAAPRVPCLFHGAPDTPVAAALRLVKLGAFHYLPASAPPEEFHEAFRLAVDYAERLAPPAAPLPWRKFLVGSSPAMQSILDTIRLVAERRSTVLITGETGTGKEMVARALHAAGNRAHLPMVAVNCTALPENLLEAELFGHVKGAFTGAIQHRVGRFEQAHNSTLFLDEIADMPLDLQAKLLRVLQEREFQRLGSSETIKVDVRVVAASNVDLLERVQQGKFREDLYYRLNVVPIHLPPLRERPGDIPALVHHFLTKVCAQEGIPIKRVTDETIVRLSRYPWPGNVRQLENAVEKAVVLSGNRDTLFPADFSLPPAAAPRPLSSDVMPHVVVPDGGIDFEHVVGAIERGILEQALRRTNGNKKLAADLLRLKRTTLTAKLKSLESRLPC